MTSSKTPYDVTWHARQKLSIFDAKWWHLTCRYCTCHVSIWKFDCENSRYMMLEGVIIDPLTHVVSPKNFCAMFCAKHPSKQSQRSSQNSRSSTYLCELYPPSVQIITFWVLWLLRRKVFLPDTLQIHREFVKCWGLLIWRALTITT